MVPKETEVTGEGVHRVGEGIFIVNFIVGPKTLSDRQTDRQEVPSDY